MEGSDVIIITLMDMSASCFYEMKRRSEDPELWSVYRVDYGKQTEPDSVPGEVLAESESFDAVIERMKALVAADE